MFGSAILDIAIGLVFVYLTLSLVVTAINELFDSLIKLRADQLAKGVVKLLGTTKAEAFFGHVLIKAQSPDSWQGWWGWQVGPRKPSYIAPETFANTVIDLLAPASVTEARTVASIQSGINALQGDEFADLKKSLSVLLSDGQLQLDQFRNNLQTWYNDQMERVAGWYKRKKQLITLFLALAISVGLNVDTLLIVRTLSNDSALRASLVAQAQEIAKQPLPQRDQKDKAKDGAPDEPTKAIANQLAAIEAGIQKTQGLGMPIGWPRLAEKPDAANAGGSQVSMMIVGWLLTTFAISLGAPFWFDMLSKVMSIRSAGKPPADETTMQDPAQ